MRLAVIIPAYGHHELTLGVVAAIHREAQIADAWVVDNQGGYEPVGDERVIRPGENLGWLRGTNAGLMAAAQDERYDGFVLLNNDVDLAEGFFADLAEAQRSSGAGVVGPTYDGYWVHQHVPSSTRGRRPRRVPFIDGTCMLLNRSVLNYIGGLDEDFSRYGWGGEIDYCVRARDAGFHVVITTATHLVHHNEATAVEVHGDGYGTEAWQLMAELMTRKHGPDWDRRAGIGRLSHQTSQATAFEQRRDAARRRVVGVVRDRLHRG